MKPTMETKVLSLVLVAGIPIMGIVLVIFGVTIPNDIIFWMGIFLIMLFPIVIAANVLRAKSFSGR